MTNEFLFGNPNDLKSDLSRAYRAYRIQLMRTLSPRIMSFVSLEMLDDLEKAASVKNAAVTGHYQQLTTLLQDGSLVESELLRGDFERIYIEALVLAFPATTTLAAHEQSLSSWTQCWSLTKVDHARLRGLELAAANGNPTFKGYVDEITQKLKAAGAPSLTAYREVFEVYSEALVLEFLHARLVWTERVPVVKNSKRPDFKCRLDDGQEFFIEVKSLDVAGVNIRQDDMMLDAVGQKIDLQNQLAQGKTLAAAEREIAPYNSRERTKGMMLIPCCA